jgi:hypothetical protein
MSHAYEGGHLDHDACSFLATHIATTLAIPRFEFPLYWSDVRGNIIQQQFRESDPGVALAETKRSRGNVTWNSTPGSRNARTGGNGLLEMFDWSSRMRTHPNKSCTQLLGRYRHRRHQSNVLPDRAQTGIPGARK